MQDKVVKFYVHYGTLRSLLSRSSNMVGDVVEKSYVRCAKGAHGVEDAWIPHGVK